MSDSPMDILTPPRRSWWKTVALSAALFASGVVIGVGLTLMGIRNRLDEFRSRPDLLSQRMVQRMEHDLGLTSRQTEEIRKIFDASREEADAMRQRNRAQAQAFFREFQNKVAQVLTPSQQKEWEEWFRKARDRAMQHRPGDRDEKRGDKPGENRGFRDGPPPGDRRDGPPPPPNFESEIGPPPPGIPEHHFAPKPGDDAVRPDDVAPPPQDR